MGNLLECLTMGSDPAFGSGPVATMIQHVLSLLIYFATARLATHTMRVDARGTQKPRARAPRSSHEGSLGIIGRSVQALQRSPVMQHVPRPPTSASQLRLVDATQPRWTAKSASFGRASPRRDRACTIGDVDLDAMAAYAEEQRLVG